MPDVPRFEVDVHESAFGVWFHLRERLDDVALPIDYYLREPLDVDVDDPAALAEFVRAWGRCSDGEARDLVLGDPSWNFRIVSEARNRGWLTDARESRHLMNARRVAGAELGLSDFAAEIQLINPAEVVVRLDNLRMFVNHIEAMQRGADVDHTGFRDYLNAALSVFQVHVQILGKPESQVLQQVSAYSAAALQLWNDIESQSYRHCDECGRLFTRQRGRSSAYSRTEGVRFHDRVCANRYTQREWRRRQRAKGQAK